MNIQINKIILKKYLKYFHFQTINYMKTIVFLLLKNNNNGKRESGERVRWIHGHDWINNMWRVEIKLESRQPLKGLSLFFFFFLFFFKDLKSTIKA